VAAAEIEHEQRGEGGPRAPAPCARTRGEEADAEAEINGKTGAA